MLGAVIFAEMFFYYFIRTEKIDVFGKKTKQERQIKGTVWGISDLDRTAEVKDFGSLWTRVELHWNDVKQNSWQGFIDKINALDSQKIIVTVFSDSRADTVCPTDFQGFSCPPLTQEKYQEFLRGALDKSGQKVKFWQIEDRVFDKNGRWKGNQEQYATLLSSARKTIKSASKDNAIILAGIALGNIDVKNANNAPFKEIENGIDYIFQKSKNDFDIVDLHLFSGLSSVAERVEWLQNKMKAKIFLKPIWSLEMSGPDLTFSEYSEDIQAQEVAKRFLIGFEAGLEKILYYHWQDKEGAKIDPLQATVGLLKISGAPKPAYTAFKIFVQNLSGFNYLKRLDLGEGVFGYQISFSKNSVKKPLFVFWSESEFALTLPLEIKDNAQAIDYLGNKVAITDGKITIDSQPIYVLVK
ncbi:MAG: hypothetical protein CEN89_603 [Candidatus Berkelbacteria bacterium Licking1014_7]|uniref:Glycoside hydrolase family 5 domain-containing protein n=1 Tax=Candidatus Berkelbacteria bacterium Licking1014_7 TaxID=2017147 RepID=A0A554LIB0_9BACT|nr:MAG: hypothetical protein CEN89_603 [Candidatus Berkelbacteria bacterium Licking1014_7]